MKKFFVSGMVCAACQSNVEKAVKKIPGVSACSVNLLTSTLVVEGNVENQTVIDAVEKAGYKASELKDQNFDFIKAESKKILKRFLFSLFFLIILYYLNMAKMMKWPLPEMLKDDYNNGIIQLFLSLIILIINKKFFISAVKSFLHPNMDTLVSLGSGISFIYSCVLLFTKNAQVLYFESSAMIVTLITIGKFLESISKGKTTDALKSLVKMSPKNAVIIKDGKEVTVQIDDIKIGDVFVVRPGEQIPVDGIIIQGDTTINESALTGESVPKDKTTDDSVFAATINLSGNIKCKATKIGVETTFSKIIQLVKESTATKAPIAKIADKVSAFFIPAVIGISILTFTIWIIITKNFAYSISRAISVLVVSCPCALGLATPVAIMVANGVGAKIGILFKNSQSLENVGKIQSVAFDKTGTITKGDCQVVNIYSDNKNRALQAAFNLEIKSEHPLAKAIVKEAEKNGLTADEYTDFKTESGKGVCAKKEDVFYFGGNILYLKEKCPELFMYSNNGNELIKTIDNFSKEGSTVLIFASRDEKDCKLEGIFAIQDVIKSESIACVNELKKMNINLYMLTGDNKNTAQKIASQVGIENVYSELLPDGKAKIIKQIKQNEKIAMIGDGINDAPSLVTADIGISIGKGTDVAIDASDIVLVDENLLKIPVAIKLSRATLRNIKQNLFWAFFYNSILIPIAAGVFHFIGLELTPVFAALAMSLSSFCVVMNALRLNLFKVENE